MWITLMAHAGHVGGHDGLESRDLDEMESLWQDIKHKAGHESSN